MPDHSPSDPKRKRLVSVEFQTEVDIATGRAERRMFLKMYFDARDSGLLAAIGDRHWRTLCALATYMDENGFCYPSQARLAKDLGLSRQKTNRRIQELLAFRFQGQAIITVAKNRVAKPGGSRWANNVYQLRPVTGLAIFDESRVAPTRESLQTPAKTSVSPKGDIQPRTSVSPLRDTGKGDTNENQVFNKTFNVTESLKKRDPEEDERLKLRAQGTALAILDVCHDEHSLGSYVTIARTYPEGLIFEALSLTKDAKARRKVRKSPGAFFTDTVHRLAQERGLGHPTDRSATA